MRSRIFVLMLAMVVFAGCDGFPKKKVDQEKVALTLESAYAESVSFLGAGIVVAEPNSSQEKKLKKILGGLEKLKGAYLIAKDLLVARKALRVQHAVPLVMAALQDDKKSAFIRAFDYLSAELEVEISAVSDDADKESMKALQTALKELSELIE